MTSSVILAGKLFFTQKRCVSPSHIVRSSAVPLVLIIICGFFGPTQNRNPPGRCGSPLDACCRLQHSLVLPLKSSPTIRLLCLERRYHPTRLHISQFDKYMNPKFSTRISAGLRFEPRGITFWSACFFDWIWTETATERTREVGDSESFMVVNRKTTYPECRGHSERKARPEKVPKYTNRHRSQRDPVQNHVQKTR